MPKRWFGTIPTDGGVRGLFCGNVIDDGAESRVDCVHVATVVRGVERGRPKEGSVHEGIAVDEEGTRSSGEEETSSCTHFICFDICSASNLLGGGGWRGGAV